jgi:hypothetical protein
MEKHGLKRASAAHSLEDDGILSEDIVTIDSQIELRVRGDLPETKILNAATQFMEQKMERYLQYEYGEFILPKHKLLDGILDYDSEQKNNAAFEKLKNLHLEKFDEMSNHKAAVHRKNKFLFSVEPGFEIIIPPYDSDWSSNFGTFSGANKLSGSFKSQPVENGYGASGIGLFLSPTADVCVKFRPHCPVSYSWSNCINKGGGYASSKGGLGMTIYNASLGTIVKDENVVLWNQTRKASIGEISGGSDDLYFQNTSIGQSYFYMKAGYTYLVWMWCWLFADSGPNAASYATIDCKVPFMIVDSSSQ